MLMEDSEILLTNVDQDEINVILGPIKKTTLFSMLATNPVILQNIIEAKM